MADDRDIHRRRRTRNIVLGLVLAALVVLFFVITVVKFEDMLG